MQQALEAIDAAAPVLCLVIATVFGVWLLVAIVVLPLALYFTRVMNKRYPCDPPGGEE